MLIRPKEESTPDQTDTSPAREMMIAMLDITNPNWRERWTMNSKGKQGR